MEPLVLIPTILSAIHIVFSHSTYIAYRQWLTERDLFKRRHAAYEQLKIAAASVSASGAVSNTDIDRFAQVMSDMRFLFDKDLERFVSGIYGALLRKHALDSLLEKAAGKVKAPSDIALTEKALMKSLELSGRIANGIYRDMPEHLEKFMQSRGIR